jgi:hypothetical protein
MPAFGTLNPPPFLGLGYPLGQFYAFDEESVVTNEFSERVGVPLLPTGGARGIRIEGDFSANPGAFEFDIMESDVDISVLPGDIDVGGAPGYQQVPTAGSITTVTTGVNGASTHFGTDLIPFAGQFCCIFVKTQPGNAVTVTLRITRAA